MKPAMHRATLAGFAMIEVLITLIILLFGLLGLVGLQSRAQLAETESYQRTQASILLRDMADRISANRPFAANYVTGSALGTGANPDCTPTDTATIDLCQWDGLLKGSAETSGGSQVGAMIGARGCVTDITPVTVPASTPRFLIAVVWQGLGTSTSAPPASVACGSASYGNENLRRAVSTVVEIGDLNAL
jgi:type IV pilus assembly protein PilV